MQLSNPSKILISTIIPTQNRPSLIIRAIDSVLAQTFSALEAIVIIDGPDPVTSQKLSSIEDPRVRVIQLSVGKGGAGARNHGVSQARGEWIAFLDDDDEWLPTKLEKQLQIAQQSDAKWPIISSELIARTPKGEFIYPRRFPSPSEPLSEYLLARNSFGFGEGLIQTSTILAKRELLIKFPFQENLPKHQDWDWLLHVHQLPEVEIVFVKYPLVIWYLWERRTTTSSEPQWEKSFHWIQTNKHLVTPRAYAAFVMVEIGAQAAKSSDWKAFLYLIQEALKGGKPSFIDWFIYLGIWLVPQDFRRSVKALFQKT
ncbi:glycosyltransferase family 2 protein [Acaryochloris marina NIES-2412]|uniref:glycosyltransferase family 2 protein n=1 Tax=Acaryochloris marina TaxID=155978 RepID=UPI00405A1487